ncbi:GIY-YIG nuclease family protein [Halorubrum sp. CBA1229]|uniref:GIY-YIG nuclease family protein n=1 Tax=Halorubrum sp. CBA1229 TaxID=1853699 RepID=UPI000F3ACF80|nr:GIY-YIG nuclease family protein [Halorubrum sp. CBA1229]QKY15707.1 GIY-YIG nuclease family protein [Halorubrum sp. CBA1229]
MSGAGSPDPDEGGTYTLLVEVAAPAGIEVGALGERRFDAGAYAYTGSALGAGGFSRVDRHRRIARGDHDVRHWHVDHLLGHPAARIDRVVRSVGADVECAVADRLPAGPVDGFGASDCDCPSHLAGAEGDSLDAFAARIREAHVAAVGVLGGSDAPDGDVTGEGDAAESGARVDVVAGE